MRKLDWFCNDHSLATTTPQPASGKSRDERHNRNGTRLEVESSPEFSATSPVADTTFDQEFGGLLGDHMREIAREVYKEGLADIEIVLLGVRSELREESHHS